MKQMDAEFAKCLSELAENATPHPFIGPDGHLNDISIQSVLHRDHRYDTCGDWYRDGMIPGEGVLRIRVSFLQDWRSELCVAVHELIEAALCAHDGVSQQQVDDFDMDLSNKNLKEPGASTQAPYHQQHSFAEGVERLLVDRLGLKWAEYESTIAAL
jgi:hypothetical protein